MTLTVCLWYNYISKGNVIVDQGGEFMNDWRLTNQIKYLYQKKLVRRKITDFPDKDHEHCEFCWDKFGRSDNMLKEGYCTEDAYNWICDTCFEDFKEMFAWKV